MLAGRAVGCILKKERRGCTTRKLRIRMGKASSRLATREPRRSRRYAGFTTATSAPDSVRGFHNTSIA